MAYGRTLFHVDLLHPNPRTAHFHKCAGSAQQPFPFRVIHSPRSEARTQASSRPAAPRPWQMEHLACAGATLKDGSILLRATELAPGKAGSSAPRGRQPSSVLHRSRVSGPHWETGLEGTCAGPVIKINAHAPSGGWKDEFVLCIQVLGIHSSRKHPENADNLPLGHVTSL